VKAEKALKNGGNSDGLSILCLLLSPTHFSAASSSAASSSLLFWSKSLNFGFRT
jgi:hypothetical protein